MSLVAYISRRVVLEGEVCPAAVLVDTDSGLIVGIDDADAVGRVDELYDLGEDALLPGLIDTHVHLNEPGRSQWEGFATGTRAAAAGGITTVVDMPLNCLPPTTTAAGLNAKRAAADGKCVVDWRAWGGAENGNQAELQGLAEAGVAGFKSFLVYPGCEGLGLIDEANLRLAMPLIAATGLPLLVHAELPGPIAEAESGLGAADWKRYGTYLASRPDEAELKAIELTIRLCREFRTRVHVVHLASALALPMLRAARAEGLPITVETCPHYLFFAAEKVSDGETLLKCAPPIRGSENRRQLWQALADGTIDLVASDHSPCPPEMKDLQEGRFDKAWGGVASLALGASVVWSVLKTPAPHFASDKWRLPQLSRLMAGNPARLAGIAGRKGRLAVGFDADLMVFSTEESFQVREQDLHSRHALSPYVGRFLNGRVKGTILRGRWVFRGGAFPGEPRGREVRI